MEREKGVDKIETDQEKYQRLRQRRTEILQKLSPEEKAELMRIDIELSKEPEFWSKEK